MGNIFLFASIVLALFGTLEGLSQTVRQHVPETNVFAVLDSRNELSWNWGKA